MLTLCFSPHRSDETAGLRMLSPAYIFSDVEHGFLPLVKNTRLVSTVIIAESDGAIIVTIHSKFSLV